MLFNSIEFLIFFPVVVGMYFLFPHRFRWVLLLIASYYFYMCWRPEYALLIIFSTLVDYFCGLNMAGHLSARRRKTALALSLLSNLGMLFTFKYLGFFGRSLEAITACFNIFVHLPQLDVLLPVGISFYTFQSLSYTIDVYKQKREPEKHLGIFAAYVAFWPQLVAGPIERSTRLIPQLYEKHHFDPERVSSGLKLMAWGFFKKLVIADRLAVYVNQVFNHPHDHHGAPILLATYFFAYQIYCDFSGYSDIAIGSARVMGFDLLKNFNNPYSARSIGEFWQRWHISLSTWFRDYLYIPLGGNRVSRMRWYLNLMIVFVVSGLWHGANWTFVVWGALHGFYLVFGHWSSQFRKRVVSALRLEGTWIHQCLQVLITFHLVCFGWIFFRANSLSDAWLLITNLTQFDLNRLNINVALERDGLLTAFLTITIMEVVQLLVQRCDIPELMKRQHAAVRFAGYYLLIMVILLLGVFGSQEFIYFRF